MGVKRDYYEVMGVPKSADAAAIKKAYRRLAKKYHPDTNAGDSEAEAKFKEVTEAYNILSDKEKRKLYDQFGHAAFEGNTGGDSSGYSQGEPGSYSYYSYSGPEGFEDDFFRDMFSGMFGGAGQEGARGQGAGTYHRFYQNGFGGQDLRRRGTDLHGQVSVTFDEAVFGCEKIISLTSPDGSSQSLRVRIPAGIDSGKTIRLGGKGNPGMGGGSPGDLLLQVQVGEKPGFERKGMDVYTSVTVPFTTAVLGGEAVVPTLYGDVVCKIREGTQSGTKIRLRGKGIVSMKNSSLRGDQYTRVAISVPQDLSPEARRKLKEFEQLCRRNSGGGRGNAA
ncbi:MAG TPA: DnaJ domain-containing protein [Candidatus Choladousia intestinigallinarum]|nr:DnaJ domain-containing protein [Candidatus Choladousia intestinigallinarum]